GAGQRGDARLYALGDIRHGGADQPALLAAHVWLESLNGAIGQSTAPLLTDLSGSLNAFAETTVAIAQVGDHDLVLSLVESRSRDVVSLSSAHDIVNDTVVHTGVSADRDQPVVISGSLS